MANFLYVIAINREQWRTAGKNFLFRLYSSRFSARDKVRQVADLLNGPGYQRWRRSTIPPPAPIWSRWKGMTENKLTTESGLAVIGSESDHGIQNN